MPSQLTADIERLRSTVTSLLALISHCQSSISSLTAPPPPTTSATTSTNPTTSTTTTPPTTPPPPPSQIPPLSLLHDASSLLRAHTTKLALLITNSTPTPLTSSTALTTLLSTLQSTVLPPLLTALTILSTHNHGTTLLHTAAASTAEALRGLTDMLAVLPPFINNTELAGKPIKTLKGEELKKLLEATVLPSTGRIWSGCDQLIALRKDGLVGVVRARLKASGETFCDAALELREYLEKHRGKPRRGDEDDEDDEDEDDDDDDNEDDDFAWDDFTAETTPTSDLHPKKKKKKYTIPLPTQDAITSTLKRFKTLSILLTAITKRRLSTPLPTLSTLTPDPTTVRRLDTIVSLTEELVALVDDVVGGYYELQEQDEDEQEQQQQNENDNKEEQNENEPQTPTLSPTELTLIEKIVDLATVAQPGWDGAEDASSKLFGECVKAIRR